MVKKIFILLGIILIVMVVGISLKDKNISNKEQNMPQLSELIEEEIIEESFKEEIVGIGIGNIAPNFTLQNLYGEEESLKDYRGKNVILNFFRTT